MGETMSGFQLQRLGMLMEPEPGNPQEIEGILNPAATRGPEAGAPKHRTLNSQPSTLNNGDPRDACPTAGVSPGKSAGWRKRAGRR